MKNIMGLGFRMERPEDLSSEVKHFVLEQQTAAVCKEFAAQAATHDTLAIGATSTASILQDGQALTSLDRVTIPYYLDKACRRVLKMKVLAGATIGIGHPSTTQM